MKLFRPHLAFSVLAFVGALFCASAAPAQQAAQWNYGFVGNVATATYPGNVQVAGTLSPVTPPWTVNCGTQSLTTTCLSVTTTWNNAATTFTGIKLNVTDTASNAASLLMDLQVGGISRFSVNKTGFGYFSGGLTTNNSVVFQLGGLQFGVANDVILARDAANALALRNGVNAQDFRVYNTYTDASNYERGSLSWQMTAGWFRLGTAAAGTGVARNIYLDPAGGIVGIGGTTASFPALKRSSTELQVRLADDSGFADLASRTLDTTTVLVSALTTCNGSVRGMRHMVSDATVVAAGNFGTAVVGGGTNVVPVYCDATSWKIG